MSMLKKGDTVAFIAPSCDAGKKDLAPAVKYLEKLGLNVTFAPNLNDKYRYMAGTDEKRAETLNNLFQDPTIKALFCIRGGAGATRMLDKLNWKMIKKNLKPIIGLSDSTALQNALYAKTGAPSLTGFLPLYDFKNGQPIAPEVATSLEAALFSDKHHITSGICHIKGATEGVLVGGCLSVLLYLCGTKYFPNLSDKILLLEDIGEKTYKLDLMLNQLKQQKNFNKLKGIIIGQFTDMPIAEPADGTVEDCINDFTKGLNIPVIKDFAYGHIPVRHILPIGLPVKISATAKSCTVKW